MRVAASALHSTSDRDLVEALKALETKMRQDHSRMLAMVSELDSRGAATSLGYSNTPALLLHTLRITRAEARHRLAHAEVLHDTITPTGSVIEAALPHTAAALAQGDIDPDHVAAIHKTLKDLPHLDPEQRAMAEKVMLERAAEDDPAALARFGWKVRDLVDPDGPPPVDNEPQRPERELHRHTRRDGGMDFKGRLDATNAALFDALLVPFEKREPDDDRGHAERAGDALVDVLKMAANCPELPTHNGLKAEMTLTVSLDFLHNALDDALLPGQSYLTARDARLAACDAHILPAVMDGDSKPLDIAVPAYVVPAHIRRALVLRDKGCAFPACDRPASVCDSHHIYSWLKGGPTQLVNLVLLCPQHHRLLHRSEWEVKLLNNTAWFTPPDFVDPQRKPRRNHLHNTT
jgi:uncharacterized protein DUF222/HNH endonuclease